MSDTSEKCSRVVESLRDREVPANMTVEEILNRRGRHAVDSALLVKALLRDFGITEALEAIRTTNGMDMIRIDSIDWAICSTFTKLYGESDLDFANSTLDVFHNILWWCRGFSTDWKYDDKEVAGWMNKERLLGRYGLAVSFTPHRWLEPFEITLNDLKENVIIGRSSFAFSPDNHEMRELVAAVNQLLKCRGLAFVDADEGSDNYIFILFEAAELDRLNKKYGDVSRLIDIKKRIDSIGGRYRDTIDAIDNEDRPTFPEEHIKADPHKGDPQVLLDALISKGLKYHAQGDLENAMSTLQLSEQICKSDGDRERYWKILLYQADILRIRGDREDALGLLSRVEQICRDLNNQEGLQKSLALKEYILKYSTGTADVHVGNAVYEKSASDFVRHEYGEKYAPEGQSARSSPGIIKGIAGKLFHPFKGRIKAGPGSELPGEDNWDKVRDSMTAESVELFSSGDLEGSMNIVKLLERKCREHDDQDGMQRSLACQAIILMRWEDWNGAFNVLKEEERLCRSREKDGYHLQGNLARQALVFHKMGNLDGALKARREEERKCRVYKDKGPLQDCLEHQVQLLNDKGDQGRMLKVLEELTGICRERNDQQSLERFLGTRAILLMDSGDSESAWKSLKEQEQICRHLCNDHHLQAALNLQASILKEIGNHDGAISRLIEAENICRRNNFRDELQKILGDRALILHENGKLQEALTLNREREAVCRALNYRAELVRALLNEALLLAESGRNIETLPLLKEAQVIAEKLGDPDSIKAVRMTEKEIYRSGNI